MECIAPRVGGEAAYALQRRKVIRSGQLQGESSEWLGYESLHAEPENCKGGEYYGGPGYTNNCAEPTVPVETPEASPDKMLWCYYSDDLVGHPCEDDNMKYNSETGIWTDSEGAKFKAPSTQLQGQNWGERVE